MKEQAQKLLNIERMKSHIFKLAFFFNFFLLAFYCGCSSRAVYQVTNPINTDRLWILVNSTDYPSSSERIPDGIFLYNLKSGQIIRNFEIPEEIISPEAIEHDGTYLLVTGYSSVPFGEACDYIYLLDPISGKKISSIKIDKGTSALAIDGDNLWYSKSYWCGPRKQENCLIEINPFGEKITSFAFSNEFPNFHFDDMTINDNTLYGIENRGNGFGQTNKALILKFNLITHEKLGRHYTYENANGYAIAHDGQNLLLIDTEISSANNTLIKIREEDSELIEKIPLPIKGWITSIAFDRE